MCSNLLTGTLWAGPARGRKRGSSNNSRKTKSNDVVVISPPPINTTMSVMEKPSSSSVDNQQAQKSTSSSSDSTKPFSEFKRWVYFISNCNNKEKTHLYSLNIGTYYYCSVCHDYHKIREIR
jgi:hypothetical protein